MSEDWLDERIRRSAAEYHRPPAAPRDAMWEAIAAARERRRSRRPIAWAAWTVGIAATLVLGIGIGRWTDRRPGPATPAVTAPGLAYRVAAAQYLTRTEALLTGFQVESRGSVARGDGQFAAQAADLLATTRLMLDSPAAQDIRLKSLLEDLELVLAQIAQLPQGGDREDMRLINQGLDQHSVLLRLRTTLPAVPLPLRTQGAL
jgi:hypothetical protein